MKIANQSNKYNLTDEYPTNIEVGVSNPTEIETNFLNYTVYTIKGNDKKGQFQCVRRYSQFDFIRGMLLKRWPGCYIPALPQKKIVGNNDYTFVESRRYWLDIFCKQMAELPHLWYSNEFNLFLRNDINIIDNLKNIPKESHQDIIKKYDQKFIYIRGKSIDSNIKIKFLQFSKYLKKIQPILNNFKQFLFDFISIKNSNYQQYLILFKSVLPQYEKVCLTEYLNKNTEGKLIFSQQNDERLSKFTKKIKQIMNLHNFDQLYLEIKHQERELQSFLDIYKQYEQYQKKINELKDREKQLKITQQKLMMGKQSIINNLLNVDIEVEKKDIDFQLIKNKKFIITYKLIIDLIIIIMGSVQIDRFKKEKCRKHNQILYSIAKIQVQFAQIQKEMYSHILDNHNLM